MYNHWLAICALWRLAGKPGEPPRPICENKNASATWVDPDDAPDLADADLGQAVWSVAGNQVPAKTGMAAMRRAARGLPVGSTKPETKRAVTVRYSPEVLAAFKATGAGWQVRMDAALKDWLKTHSPG